MSLGNFVTRVLGSIPAATQSRNAFFSEKTGGNQEHYVYGSYKKAKNKSKSEKKHAVLSALTLLAFLFFLNILQNCIRDQNQTRGTLMMFGSSAPTAPQGKHRPEKEAASPQRKKRSLSDFGWEYKKERSNNKYSEPSRKSRNLLAVLQATTPSNRRLKFIADFKTLNNWTSSLSPVSDKDLQRQRLKTINLTSHWRAHGLLPKNPILSPFATSTPKSTFPSAENPWVLRKINKREGSAIPFYSRNDTYTNNTAHEIIAPNIRVESTNSSRLSHLENFPQLLNGSQRQESTLLPAAPQKADGAWKGFSRVAGNFETSRKPEKFKKTAQFYPSSEKLTENVPYSVASITTPRNMRSDYSTTVGPTDYDEYEKFNDPPQAPTQTLGLDLNTFQTYPVYNYYNHRQNIYRLRENDTTESVVPEPSTKHQDSEIDRMHNEVVGTPAQNPLFYPTKIPLKHSYFEKTKYSPKRPDYFFNKPPHHPVTPLRYKYSPFRKSGSYEPSRFHDDYIVVARYPQGDSGSFDFSKFLWTMFTSFAKPLTNLVPGLAKDSDDDSQCYDLLVCEAQRVSKFMGPTAEALTTTLGTLLSWAVTEDTRQTVIDALNSGRENTCQQQIRDCEDRSGGKSAMTVIAQVMEIKLR